ncbi:MAG: ROK family protein [Clostridia bacterium]|nr:ROK family protein [Clostridia bacterium]
MRIAGIDIGGTSIKAGIFEDDQLLHKASAKTPFANPDGVVSAIARMIDGWDVQSIGVGTAGSVEFLHDTVCASNLGWTNVKLKSLLEQHLGIPVFVDNDAQAALLAEWKNGACKGAQCALYLTLGTGIGGAMLINGKPFRGRNNLGAEFGHTIVRMNGPKCGCGRRGCFEYYASATGLRRLADGRPVRDIIDAAIAGDPCMSRVFNQYVRDLCIGLNNLIMIFDPEIIVLGGGVSGAGSFLADKCQKELRRIFSRTTDPLLCEIRIATQKNDAGIIGAAMLAPEIKQNR